MAFSLIVHTAKAATIPTGVTTDAIDTTGTKLIVISTGQFLVTFPFTPTDSYGNVWTPRGLYGSSYQIQEWECINPTVGPGHTFTLSGGTFFIYPTLGVSAWSAVGTISFNRQNGAVGASLPNLSTGAITPSQNNSLIISSVVTNQAGSLSACSLTILDSVTPTLGESVALSHAYKIQSTIASISALWSGNQIEAATILNYIEAVPPPSVVTLTVASSSGVPGGSVSLDVSMFVPSGVFPVALQLMLDLTDDVSLVSVVLGAAAIAASKPLNQVGPLISIGGFNDNVIGSGVIITLTFDVSATPSTGSITVGIIGLIVVESDAGVITSAAVPGTITVDQPIASCPLAGGTAIVNQSYLKTLVVSGGTGPYTWSVS